MKSLGSTVGGLVSVEGPHLSGFLDILRLSHIMGCPRGRAFRERTGALSC